MEGEGVIQGANLLLFFIFIYLKRGLESGWHLHEVRSREKTLSTLL